MEYLYMNAALLSSAEKYDQAIEAYNALEKKVGINDQISVEKQQIYQAAGKKKEALAELQKLIDFNPTEPRYYGLMADYYLSEKDEPNALKYYQKILEIDPDKRFCAVLAYLVLPPEGRQGKGLGIYSQRLSEQNGGGGYQNPVLPDDDG